MKRLMGLDIGDKRIGVAISDELGITAQGLETLHRTTLEKDIPLLLQIIERWEIQSIVAGMPRNMNGTYGPQAEKVKEFARLLREKGAPEIFYWDERLTSAAAERVLLEGNMSRGKRKNTIDKIAAVMILQGYLDNRQKYEV